MSSSYYVHRFASNYQKHGISHFGFKGDMENAYNFIKGKEKSIDNLEITELEKMLNNIFYPNKNASNVNDDMRKKFEAIRDAAFDAEAEQLKNEFGAAVQGYSKDGLKISVATATPGYLKESPHTPTLIAPETLCNEAMKTIEKALDFFSEAAKRRRTNANWIRREQVALQNAYNDLKNYAKNNPSYSSNTLNSTNITLDNINTLLAHAFYRPIDNPKSKNWGELTETAVAVAIEQGVNLGKLETQNQMKQIKATRVGDQGGENAAIASFDIEDLSPNIKKEFVKELGVKQVSAGMKTYWKYTGAKAKADILIEGLCEDPIGVSVKDYTTSGNSKNPDWLNTLSLVDDTTMYTLLSQTPAIMHHYLNVTHQGAINAFPSSERIEILKQAELAALATAFRGAKANDQYNADMLIINSKDKKQIKVFRISDLINKIVSSRDPTGYIQYNKKADEKPFLNFRYSFSIPDIEAMSPTDRIAKAIIELHKAKIGIGIKKHARNGDTLNSLLDLV